MMVDGKVEEEIFDRAQDARAHLYRLKEHCDDPQDDIPVILRHLELIERRTDPARHYNND